MSSRRLSCALPAAVALLLVASAPGRVEAGSAIEVLAGNGGVTLDFQIFGDLMPRVRVFSRNRASASYEADIGYYGFTDLFVNIVGGLSAATEIQHGTSGFVPRMGLAYSWRFRELSLFGILTARCIDRSDFEFFGAIKYRPELNERFHLVFINEILFNLGAPFDPEQEFGAGNGVNKVVERVRLGFGWDRYEITAAADLKRVGAGDIVYNVGGALRVTF